MNKLKYIIAIITCFVLSACEKTEIPDAPNFDKTEILLVNVMIETKEISSQKIRLSIQRKEL